MSKIKNHLQGIYDSFDSIISDTISKQKSLSESIIVNFVCAIYRNCQTDIVFELQVANIL